jgi:hypothetical protein
MRNYNLQKTIVYYARPQDECRAVTARYPLASFAVYCRSDKPFVAPYISTDWMRARTHTHTTFYPLVEQIGLPLFVTRSEMTNLPSLKKER